MVNQKEEAPFAHYLQRFAALTPGDVENRLPGTAAEGEYRVKLLGREYGVAFPEYALRVFDGGPLPNLTVQTLLLRYLLEGHSAPWGGGWKTFRELPWGEVYTAPFTGRVLTRAAYAFGGRLEAFRRACEKMGARPIAHGDAGYQFDFLGDYRLQLLLWAGDEEFPPGAQLLYSDNFAAGFTAEDRVVAGDLLINTIKSNLQEANT